MGTIGHGSLSGETSRDSEVSRGCEVSQMGNPHPKACLTTVGDIKEDLWLIYLLRKENKDYCNSSPVNSSSIFNVRLNQGRHYAWELKEDVSCSLSPTPHLSEMDKCPGKELYQMPNEGIHWSTICDSVGVNVLGKMMATTGPFWCQTPRKHIMSRLISKIQSCQWSSVHSICQRED